MRRVLTMIRKEFIHITRDRRTLSLVFMMPFMMLLLMGYAIAVDIHDIPTMVYDQSRSAESRRFIERFWQTGDFKSVGYADNANDIVNAIDSGVTRVGIIIPPDFAERLIGGQATAVQVFIDGSDPNTAQRSLFVSQAIGQAAAVEMVSQQVGSAGGGFQLPIDLRPRLLYNPDMKQINFVLPGIVGTILQMQALLLTAVAIVR